MINMRSLLRNLPRTCTTVAFSGRNGSSHMKSPTTSISYAKRIPTKQNILNLSTSTKTNQASEFNDNTIKDMNNSVGYKSSQVSQTYVAAGLNNIEPVKNLLNGTKTNIQFEIVHEFEADADELNFFYEDQPERLSSLLKGVGFKGKQGQIYTSLADPQDSDSSLRKRKVAVGLGKSTDSLRIDTFRNTIKSVYDELKRSRAFFTADELYYIHFLHIYTFVP